MDKQQLLATILAVLERRGLSYLGIAVGGASGIPESALMELATAAAGLILLVVNEVWQARRLHTTAKAQGGILPPIK